MHETAQKIVSLFNETGSELSTSQILEGINSEYVELRNNISKRNDEKTKRTIAQIHRKILHHLNKLVDIGILRVVKYGEKGEKFFSLNLGEGEEILEISPKYKRRVVVSRPVMPLMPIEGYEQKGVVMKYEPATWIDRLNSVVIFCDRFKDEHELYEAISENIFPIVNDTIHLNYFEILLNEGKMVDFISKTNRDCEDYGKFVSIEIDVGLLTRKENLFDILDLLSENKLNKIKWIFSMEKGYLEKYSDIISKVVESFSKNKIELYIKNKTLHKAPYFIGRAGPYCFVDKEWQLAESLRNKVVCLGCSQSSAIVDVNKFFDEYGLEISKFSELMFNISKSVLSANSIQRRKSEDCFRRINYLNKGYEAEFLSLSRNYIRFWNFGLLQKDIDSDIVFNMINEAKKKIDEFSAAEETIYKSCGMTTRFRLALSPAFSSASKLSPAKYLKMEIKSVEDIDKKEIKKALKIRESVRDIFNGGDEITFHYVGKLNNDEIMKQIRVMLSNYKISLFNYGFDKVKGDLSLINFLE